MQWFIVEASNKPGEFARPHRGHAIVIVLPHRPQNRSSGPAARPQLEQTGVTIEPVKLILSTPV